MHSCVLPMRSTGLGQRQSPDAAIATVLSVLNRANLWLWLTKQGELVELEEVKLDRSCVLLRLLYMLKVNKCNYLLVSFAFGLWIHFFHALNESQVARGFYSMRPPETSEFVCLFMSV